MKEESISFGSGLQGIYIRAGGSSVNAEPSPVFVLINAGFLHSIGPNRLYTDLCRRLAVYGFDSLRFDLPGIGNSLEADSAYTNSVAEGVARQESSSEVVTKSINEALSILSEESPARKFVLCGLCSGADDALEFARHDDRVAGIVAIDSAGFRTPGFYLYHFLQHYPRRLLSLSKWQAALRAVLDRSADKKIADSDPIANANDGYRKISEAREFRDRLTDIISRNSGNGGQADENGKCEMLFVYTGGVAHYYNHEEQFNSMIKDIEVGEQLRVNYYPDSDHLLLVSAHREALIKDTINWACSNLLSCDPGNSSDTRESSRNVA